MQIPPTPPPLAELIGDREPEDLVRLASSDAGKYPQNKYLHWSELTYREPPEGFSKEDWWLSLKMARMAAKHVLPLEDERGRPFAFTDSGYLNFMLHKVDRMAGSAIALQQDVIDADARDRYLKTSVIEEAITSSQLEGASTTRLVAKDMLRSGRPARDNSERMIVNNYRAMAFVRDLEDTDISMPILLELQRILTDGVLDEASGAGRLRRVDEDVTVVDKTGDVVHKPPNAARLAERLERIFAFANSKDEAQFLRPVVKAILLHFMLGYEHPFTDGNGRTARALFYWAMARAGYWLAEFLSISTIIRNAPAQYVRAYLLTEHDDNDTTYFLDYNLRVLLRAIEELRRYIARKAKEMEDTERHLESAHISGLNHRQVAAIRSLRQRPNKTYTIDEHRRTHRVTYQTARTDLLKLADLDLLKMRRTLKQGRAFHFTLAPDLESRLDAMAER